MRALAGPVTITRPVHRVPDNSRDSDDFFDHAPTVLSMTTPRANANLPSAPKQLPGKLAGLSLWRQIWVLAIWPFWEGVMSWLVGTVDLMLAGRLPGESVKVAALDALGVSGYISWLMVMVFAAVGVGATALIARAIGGQHKRLANSALGQAMLLAGGSGVIFGAAMYGVCGWIGRAVGLQDQALVYCVLYLQWVAMAAPFFAVLLVGNAALRAAGDTRSPFVVMIVVNVVNIVMSWAFVFGPGAIGGHGVAGIAWGTMLAWVTGSVLTVAMLRRGSSGLRLRLIRLRPHMHTIKRILRVSVPGAIESIFAMWLGNFFVIMIVGALGGKGLQGAHMIAVRIESMSFLAGVALGTAAATLVGQYLGMGDIAQAKRAARRCWLAGSIIMVGIGILFFAIPETLVRMVTDATPALEHCPPLIRMYAWIQLPFATYLVLSGVLRGVGDTRVTMRMTAMSTFLVRLPLAYALAIPLAGGLYGLWLALCFELTFRGVIFALRFLHGGWTRLEV